MIDHGLAEVRALVARIASKESKLGLDLDTDPRWLTLPPAQRDRLVDRHEALASYDGLTDRTTDDARRLARSVGMKVDNFHRLFRIWQEGGRDPLAIAPYRNLKKARSTRLPHPGTADAISGLVERMLDSDPLAEPREVIAYVKAHWAGPGDLPSDVTLRNFHDKAVGDRRPARGTLTLNFSNAPQEQAVQATAFAEVLVIDHTAPGSVLVDGRSCVTPTMTLAIDLWSGVPLGTAVTIGKPCAAAVVEALQDVKRRLATLGDADAVRPRILYASTFDRQWDELRQRLLDHDIDLIERRDVNLHHGGPIKRMLGTKFGQLDLQPRLAGRPPRAGAIDPEKVAILDARQLLVVIDAAIDGMIEERLGDLRDGQGTTLDIPHDEGLLGACRRSETIVREVSDEDEHDLLARIRTALGSDLISIRITDASEGGDQMRIQVTIRSDASRSERWLDLAAEAIAIRKETGVTVEFDLKTGSPGAGDAV